MAFGIARLLSDEGVAALMAVAQNLREFTVGNKRIQYMLWGRVYRSRFLRDFMFVSKGE
jgi:hypothetical protein